MLHGLHYAEFVPAAPLLPALAELVAFVVALGLCIVASYFVRALFGTAGSALGWIPWVGKSVKGQLHSIEQKLTGELSGVIAGLDHRMAASWYKLARTAKWMAEEIAANAGALAAMATLVANPLNIPAWRSLWNSLHGTVKALPATVTGRVTVGLRPITARVSALERWTQARVHALAHAIDVAIPADIAGLRKRTKTVEGSLSKAWDKIKANEGRFTGLAFAGLVAAALARLGVSWVRCNNWKRLGREVCGTPFGDIEAVLGLVAAGAVVADFRELVKLGQQVEHGVASVLQDVAKL